MTSLYNLGNRADSCVLSGIAAVPDTEYVLKNLVANVDLNGHHVRLQRYDPEKQRWGFLIQDGDTKYVKPETPCEANHQ